jgi:exosome complex component RRP42
VDIHILGHDGNLIDAAMLAAVSALSHATVPAKRFEVGESDYPLAVRHLPIECTFVRLGDTIVVDPTFDEEHAAQGRITVATDEAGRIVAMQKGLVGAFSPDDVKAVVRRAFTHGDRLRTVVPGGQK